jgi:succinate dehydrogenase/fumarate reductase iron-sulfur protein
METPKTYSVKIYRTHPGDNSQHRYDTFTIPYQMGQSILGVLKYIYENLDSSLAYYDSCRIGKCTGCHIRVNGKTRLACTTVANGEDLLLEPLAGFTVIRDLVVDRTQGALALKKEHAHIQEEAA